jgi:phytoene synthase
VYCERVASAVGLASIEIFGYTNPQTRRYAVELGVALQLTNILRDVGADAARGRLYIPLDELNHFRVEEEQIFTAADGGHNAQLRLLLGYQAERARQHYEAAQALLPPEDRRSMLPAEMMSAVYREILDELVRRGFPIAGPRLRLSRARKGWIAVRTIARSRWPA